MKQRIHSYRVLGLIFALLLGVDSSDLLAQTTATIQGKIVDEKGEGIPFVQIFLKNTTVGTSSDENGNYSLDKIPPAAYQLHAAAETYMPFSQEVYLSEGDILHLNLTIRESETLDEVYIVLDGNPITDKRSVYVAKMPIKYINNPQVYDVVPKELFQRQMAFNMGDILRNVAGSTLPATGTKGKQSLSLRGFGLKIGIKDGMASYTSTATDLANVEKLEVVRGPSGTLYGAHVTSFGGFTNVITKKPYKQLGAELSYTYKGQEDIHRVTADVNIPLTAKEDLLFRINVAGEDGQSWQDVGFAKSIFVAPALTYEITDKIKLNVQSELYKTRATSAFDFDPSKSGYTDVRDIPIDWRRSFGSKDMYYNAGNYNFTAGLFMELGKDWTSETKVSTHVDPLDGFTVKLITEKNDELYNEATMNDPRRQTSQNIQQNFTFEKKLGSRWENKLLLGFDYYNSKTSKTSNKVKFDSFNYADLHDYDENTFSRERYDQLEGDGKYKSSIAKFYTLAGYFSNVISLDDRYFLMASLRVDRLKNTGTTDLIKEKVSDEYNQTALSPKFGLVYQLIKDRVSLFGNYMNSFENVNGIGRLGDVFKPMHANQWETGVKIDLLDNRLVSTFSLYDIKVDNMLRPDPADNDYDIQDATQVSRGVDFVLSYNIAPGLNLQGGYSYNHSKYTRAGDNLQGLRPSKAGPLQTANFWLDYKFIEGKLKGIGIAGGGYMGGSVNSVKSVYGFHMPGYTVFSSTIYYNKQYYKLGVKIDNITSEDYWDERLRKHNPRTISANLTLQI